MILTNAKAENDGLENRKDTVLRYNDTVLSFFLGDSGPPGPPGPPGLVPSGVKIDKSKKNKNNNIIYVSVYVYKKYIYI